MAGAAWLALAVHRCHAALALLPTPILPTGAVADPAAIAAWKDWATTRASVAEEAAEASGKEVTPELEADRSVQAWLAGVQVATPARVRAYLERRATALAGLHRVLAMPGLRFDVSPGFNPTSTGTATANATADDVPTWDGNLLDMRLAALELRMAARAAADPSATLRDLDALLAALRPPRSLLAVSIAEIVAGERDRAYLAAALSGTLAEAVQARWLAEPPCGLADLAAACAAQAAYWIPAEAASEVARGPLDYRRGHLFSVVSGKPLGWLQALDEWSAIPDRAARDLDWTGKAERRFRGQGEPLPRIDPWAFPYSPAGLLVAMGDAAVKRETAHRLARLAAVVAGIQDAAGDLPVDLASTLVQAPIQATDVGHDRPAVRFTRLSDDRFRIQLDPVSPLPEFLLMDRLPAPQPSGPCDPGLHATWVDVQHVVIGPAAPQANQ